MRTFLSCFFCALLFAAVDVQAQGALVARGAHGFLLGGDMSSVDDRSSYTAEVGYSFKGTLDAGFAYNWIDAPADSLGWNLRGRSLEPTLTLHLFKQGTRIPLSLSVVGGYAFKDLEPDADAGLDAVIDGKVWRLGGILHTVFAVADFAGLRPWTGLVYHNRTHEYDFLDDESNLWIESDDTQYLVGLEAILMPTPRSVLFVGPRLSFMGGDRAFGVTGGIVFN